MPPHSDRRNWQRAATVDEYLRNCREGLEEFSERRFAKLIGLSRATLYRAKLMAELPEELFERLVAAGVRSTKAMAQVALALKRDTPFAHDVERCWQCGAVQRRRAHINKAARDAVRSWVGNSTVTSGTDTSTDIENPAG